MTLGKSKRFVYGEFFLLLGMTLNSLAISMLIKADFGISAISSVPYVISVAFPVFSLGTWNALIQCLWLLFTMIAIGKLKPGYLFSFVLAFVFGMMLDGWTNLLSLVELGFIGRIVMYGLGFCLLALGIGSFFICGTPVLPFDTVPRAFVEEKGMSVRTARTAYDLGNLALSLAVSLLFIGQVIGIGWGTLFSALLMGTAAGKVNAWMSRTFEVRPYFSVLGKLV